MLPVKECKTLVYMHLHTYTHIYTHKHTLCNISKIVMSYSQEPFMEIFFVCFGNISKWLERLFTIVWRNWAQRHDVRQNYWAFTTYFRQETFFQLNRLVVQLKKYIARGSIQWTNTERNKNTFPQHGIPKHLLGRILPFLFPFHATFGNWRSLSVSA